MHRFETRIGVGCTDPLPQQVVETPGTELLVLDLQVRLGRFAQQSSDLLYRARRARRDSHPFLGRGHVGVDHSSGRHRQLITSALRDDTELVVDDHLPFDQPEQALEQRQIDMFALEVLVVTTV